MRTNPLMKSISSHFFFGALIRLFGTACQGTSNATYESTTSAATLTYKSMIRSLYQDKEGGYWVGSHGEGLAHFKDGQFRYYTKEDGLPSNQIRRIQADQEGDIWLETAAGISAFDGKTFTNHQETKGYKILGEEGIPINMTTTDHLWFGSGDTNGVLHCDGQTLTRWRFPVPKSDPDFDENGYHPEYGYDRYAVYGIYQTTAGDLWL